MKSKKIYNSVSKYTLNKFSKVGRLKRIDFIRHLSISRRDEVMDKINRELTYNNQTNNMYLITKN